MIRQAVGKLFSRTSAPLFGLYSLTLSWGRGCFWSKGGGDNWKTRFPATGLSHSSPENWLHRLCLYPQAGDITGHSLAATILEVTFPEN